MLIMMLLMAFPLLGIALFFFLPWQVALPCYLAGIAVSVVYHRAMNQSRKLRVTTGRRGMIGETATVTSWRSGEGTVRCHGETWRARTLDGAAIAPDDDVLVVDFSEPMVLFVRPLESPAEARP
jgi:membrane protein implicated in regulation of membrane protease activity